MAGLPTPIIEALRRVARLYLQKKIELEQVGARLREERVPGAGDEGLVPFPEDVAVAVEPAVRAILAEGVPGKVEPDRVQEVAGQLVTGVTPVLREIYGRTGALIPEQVVDRLLSLLEIKGDNSTILRSLRERLGGYPQAEEGIAELEEMLHYLDLLGVPEHTVAVDVSMARGLDYYTGPIYETIVEEAGVGSVTGGGRFDNLVGMFTGRSLPATGTTIGIERIIVVMEEQNMFPPSVGKTATQVLVTAFDRALVDESIRAAGMLRQAGLRTQIYFDPDPLREQIGYAVNKGIPVVVILGPDEVARGQLTVRNLRTRQQAAVEREQAPGLIQEWLVG